MNLQEGTTLHNGQYCIIRPLGQGGFGITYLAEDTLLRRQVVIKEFFIGELCFRENETSKVTVLSEGGRKTVDHFRKKFFREAQIVAGLSHPNIITIHAVFEENNTAYYVMNYHPNGSLQDKLKELRGPMAEADALRYIRQVADALDEIHKKQLRHLDVKPSNIMLNQRGEAVLIDFGLVKVYDEEGNPLSTHSSTQNGYSSCFSPMEQVFSDKDTVFTPATDIYALGATLYNLVEGTVPPTIDKVAKMKGNLPFSDTTSQPMRKAITEAMQLNAEDRPQTIAEFLKLLPLKATDPSVAYQKDLAEGIAFFQVGKYVKALSRFLVLLRVYPAHKAEIEEWMMKCTEKMNDSESGGGETLRRKDNPPTPPKPTPTPAPRPKIVKDALLLVLIVALAFIFLPKNCKGGGELQSIDEFGVDTPVVDSFPVDSAWVDSIENDVFWVDSVDTSVVDTAYYRELNSHQYVDLGLSVIWATCNVGASRPSDYGDYFAWGEISPKSEYTKENSVTWEKSLGDIGGNVQYDAARAGLGGSWRLPTFDELIELKEKCKWTWTTQGGHNGYKVTGPSGKSIFLPAAGWHYGASPNYVGECGYYWSSSPYESDTQRAYFLYFHSSHCDWLWYHRGFGRSVRPVSD